MSPEYRDAYRRIKQLFQNESVFPVEHIHQETGALRSSIFAEELKNTVEAGDTDLEKVQQKQLLEAYRALDKIAITLTDDFYPVNLEMKRTVDALHFDFKNGMSPSEFERVSVSFTEVKNAVVDRLSNIKQMITKKKLAERDKSKKTQKQILWLRKKISQAETESRKLSIQADRFKEEANKDGLTGLYNRSAFDAMIANALESYNRGGDSFLLVMFDVDNFKWVNDTFGHVAGDKILQKVATALSKTFRKDEFIARYGGDEFVVIIEGLTEATAQKRISTFKETFHKMRFSSHKDGDVQIGISEGIASVITGDTPDDLIHKADSAMYEVKKKRKIKS